LTRWTTAGLRIGCVGVLLLQGASLATADFTGPVVSVLDGDTIEVLYNTHPEQIRLNGIDQNLLVVLAIGLFLLQARRLSRHH